MASQKAVENAQRLRYIRALERFHKSILSYLANTLELTRESYVKKITNAQKVLKRVDEIALYKGELQDLQKLVKKHQDMNEVKSNFFESNVSNYAKSSIDLDDF